MPRPLRLPASVQRVILLAVDTLFDRIKARMLGPGAEKLYGKQLVFRYAPELSLTGLFVASSNSEGMKPNEDVLKTLLKIAGSYVDAHRERTKAKIIQQISSFLTDASAQGIKTDVKTVLGGQLAGLWGEVHRDIKRIVETETTVTRNTSIHDAIGRIGVEMGINDPLVFFVTVRDEHRCSECTRLHMLPDQVTPRVWKQSEIGAGYHRRGEETPKIAGLHPHCRCVLTTLMPGYSFDAAGRITYVGPDHDEFKAQRG